MSSSSGIPNDNRTSEFSPEKWFKISVRQPIAGSPKLRLAFGKKVEGDFIYQFKNIVTGEIYVGETRRLSGRVSAHISTANKSGKPSAKKTGQRLYAALKENPENFLFGVLNVDGSPRKVEKLAIQHYLEVANKSLYNMNRGGGGPKGALIVEVAKLSLAGKKPGAKVVKSLAADFENLNQNA